ncbi:MAG: hypothetical protein ACYC2Y_08940 [Armatimonadota bacterium]
MKRFLIPLLAVLAGFAVLITYLHPLGRQGPKLPEREAGFAVRFEDAKLVGWSKGKRTWVFNADSVELARDRRTVLFSGVRGGAMLRNGKKAASISTRKLFYDTFSRDVTAPGKVLLKLAEGPTFSAGRLQWNEQASTVVVEGGVDVGLPFGSVHGKDAVADLSKKELTMRKVSGTLKIEEIP